MIIHTRLIDGFEDYLKAGAWTLYCASTLCPFASSVSFGRKHGLIYAIRAKCFHIELDGTHGLVPEACARWRRLNARYASRDETGSAWGHVRRCVFHAHIVADARADGVIGRVVRTLYACPLISGAAFLAILKAAQVGRLKVTFVR